MLATRLCKLTLLGLSILTLGSWAGASEAARQFYRYLDENGVTVLDDSIPPEYVSHGYTIVDERGLTVKVVPPAKTDSEIAREQALAKELREQQRQADERAAADRRLLDTYAQEEDLVAAHEGRVATIDNVLTLADAKVRRLNANLDRLQALAAENERSGQRVPESRLAEIQRTRAQIAEQLGFIRVREGQKRALNDEFERDLARYQELRAMTPGELRATLNPRIDGAPRGAP